MKVIVHVGSPKTGTSSLQDFLYRKRDELAERGIAYPDFGFRAHTLLSAAFSGREDLGIRLTRRIDAKKNSMELSGFEDHLRELVVNCASKLLIFSNEGLSHRPRAGNLVKFLRSIRPDAEIMTLDYIREPVAHFPSTTQQNLKLEGDHTLYPATWISPHCIRGRYLQTAIEHDLTFRIFSSTTLINGDVIDDFADFVQRRTGLEMPPNDESTVRNISSSAPACGMMALGDLVTDKPFPSEHRNPFFAQLRTVDEALKPEKLSLPADFRQAIIANNHKAWNSLVDMSDHDPATRERMKLPSAIVPEGMEKANTGTWAVSSLTRPYLLAFLRALRGNMKPRGAREVIPWVVHAVNATQALHGIEVSRGDMADLKQDVELGSNRPARKRRKAQDAEGDPVELSAS